MKYLLEINMLNGNHKTMIGHHDKMYEGIAGYDVCGTIIKCNKIRPFPHNGYTTDYICDCEEWK